MWVGIVRVVGWSECPTTRRSMLYRKIAIIIKRKFHASLSLFSMQLSHIKYQPYFFKKKKENKNKQNREKKIKNFFFFYE